MMTREWPGTGPPVDQVAQTRFLQLASLPENVWGSEHTGLGKYKKNAEKKKVENILHIRNIFRRSPLILYQLHLQL